MDTTPHLRTMRADMEDGDQFMRFVEQTAKYDYPGLEFYWDVDRQMTVGEGNLIECKLNRGLWKWQSMFVETGRRSFVNEAWEEAGQPSGLLRPQDRTTHIAMGDYRLYFVIPKAPLVAMIPEDNPDFCRETRDKSKKGFRLYFPGAFEHAEHIYLFGALADHYRGGFPDPRVKLWACDCKEVVFELPGPCPACGRRAAT